jgi:N-acetylmuramoyl-L-alanine amidase
MYNPKNEASKQTAIRLSNAIQDNGQVPKRDNRPNTGYIGEMNVINPSTIPVLLELGFFSNLKELEVICSDDYVQDVTTKLANEITNIIKESR